jgi:hypothetical protein
MERATGIEPAWPAWKAGTLPLSYTRDRRRSYPQFAGCQLAGQLARGWRNLHLRCVRAIAAQFPKELNHLLMNSADGLRHGFCPGHITISRRRRGWFGSAGVVLLGRLLRFRQKLDEGEGDAFFKLGEHQFLAMFEVKEMKPDQMRHFGIMVRDEAQLAEVRDKITKKYGLKLIPGFRCDFRDPFGNRIQVVDLHDESLVWLLPYQEVQKAGIKFAG